MRSLCRHCPSLASQESCSGSLVPLTFLWRWSGCVVDAWSIATWLCVKATYSWYSITFRVHMLVGTLDHAARNDPSSPTPCPSCPISISACSLLCTFTPPVAPPLIILPRIRYPAPRLLRTEVRQVAVKQANLASRGRL